ncbi:MAG: lactate utilization protein [Acidobacteriota bacterium]
MINPKPQNTSREAMLAEIRKHLNQSLPFDALYQSQHALQRPAKVQIDAAPNVDLFDRFKQSLEAVMGNCVRVVSEKHAAEVLQAIIDKLNARRIAVSDSPLIHRVLREIKLNGELIENPGKSRLFECDMGISSAQWAIAETGTLVIESDSERHRLVSLVPPVHVAIFEVEKIVQTMSEVLASIGQERELSRTITFITGPSRTSDIELTLAIGVHGPAKLFVIVIDGATNG